MSTLPFIPKPRDIDTESLTIPLAKWAETRIRDLHNAFNDEELESRLQSIFSNSTEVVIIEGDGTTLSLEGLRGKLRRGRGEPEGVQVISVSTTADNPNQPKLVRSQKMWPSTPMIQMKTGWKSHRQRSVRQRERRTGDRLDVR